MDFNYHSNFGGGEICEQIFCGTATCATDSAPSTDTDQLVKLGLEKASLINFASVKMKLMSPEFEGKYASSEIDGYIQLYREFLAMHYAYEQMDIVPTKAIDLIWHQHILDTRAYAHDCELIFGHFLHHYPYFGLNGPIDEQNLADAFNKTCEIWKLHFGRSPKHHESENCSSCGAGSCSAGSCSSCR